MSGLIAPGATLSARSLATELLVSAQPVRDALKRLEADGVLLGKPQSGFFLHNLTVSEYREIAQIRMRLEGLAVRRAIEHIAPAKIIKLKEINERIGRSDKPQDYLSENYRFHFSIYEEARMPALLAIIENLWMRVGPAWHHHPYDYNLAETRRKHEAIIDALERRDADAAEASLAYDISDATEKVVVKLPPG
ncbi:hypothetical protein ASD12_26015 [Mesorhizobium sp. Root102]|nr:hypothetical protein ASD12_26015 [Mesorhizobium sp. Root102]